jgi:hypothetical protein
VLNLALRHEAYEGIEVYLHTFLTSALEGKEQSASQSGRFTPRDKAASTHQTGG